MIDFINHVVGRLSYLDGYTSKITSIYRAFSGFFVGCMQNLQLSPIYPYIPL
nr:MAG TPA: hypothetical protein [Caudoviricetes sp.]